MNKQEIEMAEKQKRIGLEYKRRTPELVVLEVSPFYEDTNHFGRVVYTRMSDGTIERIKVGDGDGSVFVGLPYVGDKVTIIWDYSRQGIVIHNTHRLVDLPCVWDNQYSSLIARKEVLEAWGRDPYQRHMLTMERVLGNKRIRSIALKLVSPELRHLIETALLDKDYTLARIRHFGELAGIDMTDFKL